jgi:hypothetical protein
MINAFAIKINAETELKFIKLIFIDSISKDKKNTKMKLSIEMSVKIENHF